jgi:hypothetical protein
VDLFLKELNHFAIPMSTTGDFDVLFPPDGGNYIRMTPGYDPRASAVDVVQYVTRKNNNDTAQVLRRLQEKGDASFWTQLEKHQFSGRGQKKQFVFSYREAKDVVMIIPGKEAMEFRSERCQLLDVLFPPENPFGRPPEHPFSGRPPDHPFSGRGPDLEDLKTELATSRAEGDDLKTELAASRQEVDDLKIKNVQEVQDLKRKFATSLEKVMNDLI